MADTAVFDERARERHFRELRALLDASSVSYGDFVELLFELLDERRRVPLEERLRGD
jgi:hypothetical protein